MKSYIRSILALSVALFALSSLVASADNLPPLKVGATLPLSGDYAAIGKEFQRGMELAIDTLPAGAVSVVYEDEGVVDRAKAVAGFRKLADVEKVDVVFGSTVNTVTSYGRIANQNKIPALVLWDSNEGIKELGPYVFGLGFSTEMAGERMANYAKKTLGINRIGIISAQDEWSELISGAFSSEAKKIGLDIIQHQRVNIKDGDLRSVILKMKSAGVEGIYAPLYLTSLSAAVRQVQEQHFNGHLLLADGFVESDLEALGTSAEGIYFTQLWVNDQQLKAAYEKRFGQSTSNVNYAWVALGYDAIRFVYQAWQKSGGKNRDPFRDAIANLKFKGITGELDFAKSSLSDKSESILQVQQGKFKFIEP